MDRESPHPALRATLLPRGEGLDSSFFAKLNNSPFGTLKRERTALQDRLAYTGKRLPTDGTPRLLKNPTRLNLAKPGWI